MHSARLTTAVSNRAACTPQSDGDGWRMRGKTVIVSTRHRGHAAGMHTRDASCSVAPYGLTTARLCGSVRLCPWRQRKGPRASCAISAQSACVDASPALIVAPLSRRSRAPPRPASQRGAYAPRAAAWPAAHFSRAFFGLFLLENMQCVGARASLPRALGSKCAPTAPSRAPAHGRSLKRDARGRSVSVRRMRWQTDARASHPPPHPFARARARERPAHKFSPTFPRMRPAFPFCQRARPGLPRAGATRGVRAGTSSPHPPPPHPTHPLCTCAERTPRARTMVARGAPAPARRAPSGARARAPARGTAAPLSPNARKII